MASIGTILLTVLACAVAVAILFAATFAVSKVVGKHAVVDIVWGPGFALVALVSALVADGDAWRRILLLVLLGAWGLRLGGHIFLRSRGKGEDPRYTDILNEATGHPDLHMVRKVYLTQAGVMLVVSLPVMLGANSTGSGFWVGVLVTLGLIVWGTGLFFETVGDHQLEQFKADASNQGKVMDSGLWRYTRHPNYFGDFAVWWGVFLACLGSPWVLIGVVGPLLMSRLLMKTTGKELMEKHMSKREGYADYVSRTSGFFPLPPGSAPARKT